MVATARKRCGSSCRKAYEDWGLQYVLLAGDAEHLPPRYARSRFYPVGGFTEIPADIYFAALDGNWNIDADGIYAEAYQDFINTGDGADMLAELSLGRAPIKDVAQAATFVDKVIEYSQPSDPSYLGNALFMSEVLFPQNWDGFSPISLDGAVYSENIVFNSIIGGGNLMQSWRMYENDTAYLGAIPESKTAALDSLRSGNFGLAAHVGHGFYYKHERGRQQHLRGRRGDADQRAELLLSLRPQLQLGRLRLRLLAREIPAVRRGGSGGLRRGVAARPSRPRPTPISRPSSTRFSSTALRVSAMPSASAARFTWPTRM